MGTHRSDRGPLPAVSRRAALGGAVGVGVAALASSSAAAARPPGGAAVDSSRPKPVAEQVRTLLAGLTLEQRVGQLFVNYVYGESAASTNTAYVTANQKMYGVDTAAQAVAKYHLGGVIYFSWTGSLVDPEQIATLSNGLQQAALDDSGVPLVISTDEEGGLVTRVPAPFVPSPGNMALGATRDPIDAGTAASVVAEQLAAIGINLDDAPVVDVNTNPANSADGTRSFGDDPEAVASYAAAAVGGYHTSDIGDSVKHFPGLGSTTVNTDNGIAVSDQSRATFLRTDVPPFRAAIAAGCDTVMAAHIVAPSLDPSGRPASLSRPIVTNLLRRQLRYNGVVITDALNAAALDAYGATERVLLALEAGVDQALMPTDMDGAFRAVLDAVGSGRLTERRIDESVSRILALKVRRGMTDHPLVDATQAAARVGTGAQSSAMKAITARTITLVKNAGVLPLTAQSGQKVLVTGWGSGSTKTLSDAVAAYGVTTQQFYAGTTPSARVIELVVEAARASDATIVLTNNAWGNSAQQNLVNSLVATGKPIIPVAVGTPYDIAYYDDAMVFIGASSYSTLSLHAIADVVFGTQPVGKLPVDVPTSDGSSVLYPRGTGVSY
ncbi:MAG: glycoside hydrolase family 3 protein [Mycobacteriales bacterium]